MTDTPTAVDVCCCGNCETAGHEQVTTRALTAQEIAANSVAAQAAADQKAAADAEAEAVAAAKAGAQAKLAKLGLTQEEIDALSK